MTSERGISDRYLSELDDIRATVEELRNEQVIPVQRLIRRASALESLPPLSATTLITPAAPSLGQDKCLHAAGAATVR